jgi:iron(III) transport system substrate-binding protein
MRALLVIVLLVANLAVPAFGQSLATYEGADRDERLLAAARKEGALLLYTTIPEQYSKLLTSDFEKRYGVKVNLWRARSEIVTQRVITESRAGNHNVDVIQAIAPAIEALRREKLLQEVRSPVSKNLMAGAAPAHGQWAATLLFVFVQAYNTDKVRKEDLPRSYADLLHPRWKGMLAIESSDHEWFYAVVKGMGEEKGLKLFQDLVAHNKLSSRTGHPLLTNLVASGEVALALTVYNYSPEQLKKKGAPIDWFAIEPAIAILDGIAVAARAPHPNAAVLFRDYMLGEHGQRILAQIGYVPTHTKVESPLKQTRLQVLDPSALVDEYERSNALFEEVVLGKRAAAR